MDIRAPHVSTRRAVWAMTLVSLACLLNYYDRNLLGVLVQPIKADLQLSDGQIGIIGGLAFAVVYSLSAIPVAALADRGDRARILGAALALWSLMTAMCGAARGFTGLFLARLGVGFGESGGLPTSQAIIAEHFSEAWRARALSVFAVMSYGGMALGTAVGGLIASRWGWRMSFVAGAIPGLVLAVVMLLTLKDARPPEAQRPSQTFQGIVTLLRRPALFWLCGGLGVAMVSNYAMQVWGPAFFMRQYHRGIADVGGLYALASAPAQIAGTLIGGALADVLQKKDARWPVWIVALSFGLALPLNLLFLNMPTFGLAILLMIPANIVGSAYIGPAYALAQRLSGAKLRATAAAALLMITTLIGQGVGPTLVGWLSDRFAPTAGDSSLRLALMTANCALIVGILAFLKSARTVVRDGTAATSTT